MNVIGSTLFECNRFYLKKNFNKFFQGLDTVPKFGHDDGSWTNIEGTI
jgi:hypothetical protein